MDLQVCQHQWIWHTGQDLKPCFKCHLYPSKKHRAQCKLCLLEGCRICLATEGFPEQMKLKDH